MISNFNTEKEFALLIALDAEKQIDLKKKKK
jgi:hypothetical protein